MDSPREYNPETDYHLVVEATQTYGCTLVAVALYFKENGIIWPRGYNYDKRPHIVQLDKDILKAWGRG